MKVKEKLKHIWKHHKLSTFGYVGALFYFGVFALAGIICIIKDVSLPLSFLSGIVIFLFGYHMLQIFSEQAADQFKKEQITEAKP